LRHGFGHARGELSRWERRAFYQSVREIVAVREVPRRGRVDGGGKALAPRVDASSGIDGARNCHPGRLPLD
jgi:hypothetical protein